MVKPKNVLLCFQLESSVCRAPPRREWTSREAMCAEIRSHAARKASCMAPWYFDSSFAGLCTNGVATQPQAASLAGDNCLTHRPADDDSAADRLAMKRDSLGEEDRLTDRIMANIEQLPDGWEDISDVASSMSVWTCSSGESHEDIKSPEHTPSAEGILGLISRVSTGASQPSNLQSLGSKDLTSQLGVGISK